MKNINYSNQRITVGSIRTFKGMVKVPNCRSYVGLNQNLCISLYQKEMQERENERSVGDNGRITLDTWNDLVAKEKARHAILSLSVQTTREKFEKGEGFNFPFSSLYTSWNKYDEVYNLILAMDDCKVAQDNEITDLDNWVQNVDSDREWSTMWYSAKAIFGPYKLIEGYYLCLRELVSYIAQCKLLSLLTRELVYATTGTAKLKPLYSSIQESSGYHPWNYWKSIDEIEDKSNKTIWAIAKSEYLFGHTICSFYHGSKETIDDVDYIGNAILIYTPEAK